MTTLRDVAKKANVSQMTVSRVFNHPETVSDELKELVFSAVKELNYHPNASAKALKNKKTQVIKVALCPVKYTDQIDKNFRRLGCGIVPRSSRFCLCKRVWY